jgi:hypothetical protein
MDFIKALIKSLSPEDIQDIEERGGDETIEILSVVNRMDEEQGKGYFFALT